MPKMIPLIGILMVGAYSSGIYEVAKDDIFPMLLSSAFDEAPQLHMRKIGTLSKTGATTSFIILIVSTIIGVFSNIVSTEEKAKKGDNAEQYIAVNKLINKIWLMAAGATILFSGIWTLTP